MILDEAEKKMLNEMDEKEKNDDQTEETEGDGS